MEISEREVVVIVPTSSVKRRTWVVAFTDVLGVRRFTFRDQLTLCFRDDETVSPSTTSSHRGHSLSPTRRQSQSTPTSTSSPAFVVAARYRLWGPVGLLIALYGGPVLYLVFRTAEEADAVEAVLRPLCAGKLFLPPRKASGHGSSPPRSPFSPHLSNSPVSAGLGSLSSTSRNLLPPPATPPHLPLQEMQRQRAPMPRPAPLPLQSPTTLSVGNESAAGGVDVQEPVAESAGVAPSASPQTTALTTSAASPKTSRLFSPSTSSVGRGPSPSTGGALYLRPWGVDAAYKRFYLVPAKHHHGQKVISLPLGMEDVLPDGAPTTTTTAAVVEPSRMVYLSRSRVCWWQRLRHSLGSASPCLLMDLAHTVVIVRSAPVEDAFSLQCMVEADPEVCKAFATVVKPRAQPNVESEGGDRKDGKKHQWVALRFEARTRNPESRERWLQWLRDGGAAVVGSAAAATVLYPSPMALQDVPNMEYINGLVGSSARAAHRRPPSDLQSEAETPPQGVSSQVSPTSAGRDPVTDETPGSPAELMETALPAHRAPLAAQLQEIVRGLLEEERGPPHRNQRSPSPSFPVAIEWEEEGAGGARRGGEEVAAAAEGVNRSAHLLSANKSTYSGKGVAKSETTPSGHRAPSDASSQSVYLDDTGSSGGDDDATVEALSKRSRRKTNPPEAEAQDLPPVRLPTTSQAPDQEGPSASHSVSSRSKQRARGTTAATPEVPSQSQQKERTASPSPTTENKEAVKHQGADPVEAEGGHSAGGAHTPSPRLHTHEGKGSPYSTETDHTPLLADGTTQSPSSTAPRTPAMPFGKSEGGAARDPQDDARGALVAVAGSRLAWREPPGGGGGVATAHSEGSSFDGCTPPVAQPPDEAGSAPLLPVAQTETAVPLSTDPFAIPSTDAPQSGVFHESEVAAEAPIHDTTTTQDGTEEACWSGTREFARDASTDALAEVAVTDASERLGNLVSTEDMPYGVAHGERSPSPLTSSTAPPPAPSSPPPPAAAFASGSWANSSASPSHETSEVVSPIPLQVRQFLDEPSTILADGETAVSSWLPTERNTQGDGVAAAGGMPFQPRGVKEEVSATRQGTRRGLAAAFAGDDGMDSEKGEGRAQRVPSSSSPLHGRAWAAGAEERKAAADNGEKDMSALRGSNESLLRPPSSAAGDPPPQGLHAELSEEVTSAPRQTEDEYSASKQARPVPIPVSATAVLPQTSDAQEEEETQPAAPFAGAGRGEGEAHALPTDKSASVMVDAPPTTWPRLSLLLEPDAEGRGPSSPSSSPSRHVHTQPSGFVSGGTTMDTRNASLLAQRNTSERPSETDVEVAMKRALELRKHAFQEAMRALQEDVL